MNWKTVAVGAFALSLTGIPVAANACNVGQLNDDLRYCFSTANDKGGKGELAAGCVEKDAERADRGFYACQRGDNPRRNWDRCTAGVKIDHTCAAMLGWLQAEKKAKRK